MKISSLVLVAATGLTVGVLQARAQERRPEAAREGTDSRSISLFTTLDANRDGVIDETEIANASVALKKLDKNGDGKITADETRPAAAPRLNASHEMVRRLMEFDKNTDGKLAKDEMPERLQAMFERGDADHDGFLTREEIKKMTEARSTTNPLRGEREGPRDGGARREGGDRAPQ